MSARCRRTPCLVLAAVLLAWPAAAVRAQPAPSPVAAAVEWTGSGFLSVVGGRIVKGTASGADLGYDCPCFVSDFAHGGVYERRHWRVLPDSRAGVQGTAAFDGGRRSLTAQVVWRGARRAAELEWLYASADLGHDWKVQLGRKRLPLFLSSEVQDVGYALPWTHLPPQLYGWDVVNYNGVSLEGARRFGAWLASGQVLYGNETARDAGYWQIYNGKGTRGDSRWADIVGIEAKLSREWFEARAVLVNSDTQHRFVSQGETDFSPRAKQRIRGLSFHADDGRWVGRAEFLYIDRLQDYGVDHASLLAVGRRMGRLLATATYARYQQLAGPDAGAAEGHHSHGIALRYELGAATAVKLGYEVWRDRSGPGYLSGNAHLLSVGLDQVF